MPTNNFNVTRDELITLAYQDIKVLAEGETLSSDLLITGIKKLNLIIREHDLAGKHLWAIAATPTTIPVVANTFIYTSANGLPTTVLGIVSASYRNSAGTDDPLEILTTEQYESLRDKTETGVPKYAYLTENKTITSKTLYVTPMLSSISTQSVVTGSDAVVYRCIRAHTADTTNKPITGANYLLYWEAGGSGPSVWATGTQYAAPELVRLWFKRPLYDFDAASDNPDMPQGWSHWLQQELSIRLATGHNVPLEKVQMMRSLRNESYERVFRSVQPQTTKIHNLVEYM